MPDRSAAAPTPVPSRRILAVLGLAASLSAGPAVAQPPPGGGLDPATAAIAARYAAEARTCMRQSAVMAVRAGQTAPPLLLSIAANRCGGAYGQFLTAHGEASRQAEADVNLMAAQVVAEALHKEPPKDRRRKRRPRPPAGAAAP